MSDIIHGDSLHELKKLADESVDLLCTDPPYGYSFMGKSWDKTLPDIGIFKECHRVLKPGAFAFVMSAPRSDVCARMMLMLEDAGFEIGFTPIYWTYASGFPKAMNIGKMVDKRVGATPIDTGVRSPVSRPNVAEDLYKSGKVGKDFNITKVASKEAQKLDGSYGGFQPKPAVEVVIVAMKPLSEKTYVDQALKNGKGITWLDDCRVPLAGEPIKTMKAQAPGTGNATYGQGGRFEETTELKASGRFPANLLVSDDVLNDGRVQKSGTAVRRNVGHSKGSNVHYAEGSKDAEMREDVGFGDSGSYSRYFDLDAWAKTLPFLIVPKAAKSEKNAGLDSFPDKEAPKMDGGDFVNPQWGTDSKRTVVKNAHPTVKPLKLMSYLITLGSRPGDVVLDPFLGSGTTAIAAKQLGREWIGIEREAEYVEIARARIENVMTEHTSTLPFPEF